MNDKPNQPRTNLMNPNRPHHPNTQTTITDCPNTHSNQYRMAHRKSHLPNTHASHTHSTLKTRLHTTTQISQIQVAHTAPPPKP